MAEGVRLPQPSEQIVTSEAPRSALSAEAIASPYHMLGQSLDKLGEGLEALAVPIAERAGYESLSGKPSMPELASPQAPSARPTINAPVSIYQPSIEAAAEKNRLDPTLFSRQLYQESGFNPKAVSVAGAQGIAQFMPETARRYGVSPFDPNSAISGAARYMADLHSQFGGNTGLALAGYNWGEGNVANWIKRGGNPAAMPKETRDYVQTVSGRSIEQWTNATPAEPAPRSLDQTGPQTIARDDQGNLQATWAPVFGAAGIAYARARKFSALAQGEAEAKRQDLLLSKQFHEDPQGYLAASEKFRGSLVDQYTKVAGPEVGESLGRAMDSASTYNYRWLLLEQQRNIKQNFDRDTKATIQSKADDLENIVASGGAGTPAFDHAWGGIVALYNERVNNPVLHASPEEARLELQQLDRRIGAAKHVYDVNQALSDPARGVFAAMDMNNAALKDKSLSVTQQQLNYAHGLAAIKQFQDNTERTGRLTAMMQKAADQAWETRIIEDSAKDRPEFTEHDIRTNPQMSPESKMRMLAWMNRDGAGEPTTAVSQATASALFMRMHLPDGDPRKINDLGPIRDAYAPSDGSKPALRRQDEQWLEKTFTEARSPEGQTLAKNREEFFKRYASTIDTDIATTGMPSPAGQQAFYLAEKDAVTQEDNLRRQGKDPSSLYDPRSPDFFGKPDNLSKYTKPLQAKLHDNVPATAPAASAPPSYEQIPPEMSPDQVKARYAPGTLIRLPDGRVGTVPWPQVPIR